MVDERVKRLLIGTGLLALAYFVTGKAGLMLATVHPSATAIWPPTGISIGALLVWGLDLWPGVFLGAFLVNLTLPGGVPSALGVATGNTVEAFVAAYLTTQWASGRRVLER